MLKYTSLKIAPYIMIFWHCQYCGINNHVKMTAIEFRTIKEIKCDNCKETSIISDR